MAGHRLQVRVTAHETGYADKTAATSQVLVRPGIITLNAKPRVLGTYRVGRTLSATAGTSTPTTASRTDVWYIRSGARWILKHTGRKFSLTRRDRGRRVQLRVTYRSPGFLPKTVTLTGAIVH